MSALTPADYPAYAGKMGGSKSTKLLGWGDRPALIIIDPSPAYFLPSSPLSLPTETATSTLNSIKSLLASAREGNVPIFFTQTQFTHPSLRDAGLLTQKVDNLNIFSKSSSSPWLPNLQPLVQENGEITLFHKYPSLFFGTNFQTQLQALGVDTLVICGACTSGAVRATVLDGMQHGFRSMVVKEGCADDRGWEVSMGNLFDLDAKYGDVVSEETAVGRLGREW